MEQMKRIKKMREQNTQSSTGHTLWTAPANSADGGKYEPKLTAKSTKDFNESLKQSEADLNKKLEAFQHVPITDATARCVVM